MAGHNPGQMVWNQYPKAVTLTGNEVMLASMGYTPGAQMVNFTTRQMAALFQTLLTTQQIAALLMQANLSSLPTSNPGGGLVWRKAGALWVGP